MLNYFKAKILHIINLSERWFKTDMRYILKSGFWLTLGNVFVNAAGFLMALVFANYLSKEVYGIYKYVLSVASLLTIFTLSGLDSAVTYATAKGKEGSFGEALKVKIRWGLVGGLASLCLAGFYYWQANFVLAKCFLIVALFIPFFDPLQLYLSFLNGRELFKMNAKYSATTQVFSVLTMMCSVYLTSNIYILLLAYFLTNSIFRLIFFKISLKKYKPNKEKDQHVISYGKHLSLMGVLGIIADQIDKVLVFAYLGPSQLAVYAMAIAVPAQMGGVFGNIKSLAFPRFARNDKQESKKTIFSKIWKLGFVVLLIVLCYVLLSPFFYAFFFPKYVVSIFYSQVFSFSLVGTMLTALPLTLLRSQAAKKELYYYNIISSAVRIVVLFIMIYFFGLMGVIIARVLNSFLQFFLIAFLVKIF